MGAKHVAYVTWDEFAWAVDVAGMPGCLTMGSTIAEAREMAADAIDCWNDWPAGTTSRCDVVLFGLPADVWGA